MLILAVDTSCDESCAAVVDTERWRLLSDVVLSHVDQMQAFGGIVPEIASREHLKALPLAVEQALAKAGVRADQIDHFTVTHRPGLIGALLVGVTYVKSLAFALGKPFSVQDHLRAHLYSPALAALEGGTAPAFPWIALIVSGGHSEIFHVRSATDAKWLGGTLDDAAGEAFDKVGKLLGLPYPAGPKLDRWVREQATD
ncbi:tRNA (adenosine(37)-N6)-threonylcarbamoyltransferase complex transferase subunit TsaD, partial [bacterium]|nr:tRNA (adenosine(37)-N6)-threonylcarbamoyltransferase complex transferase subunit TsaD [bacterium]